MIMRLRKDVLFIAKQPDAEEEEPSTELAVLQAQLERVRQLEAMLRGEKEKRGACSDENTVACE